MNNDRKIVPIGAVRNTYPTKLKAAFADYYQLDGNLLFQSYLIILRDLSITKCLFNLNCENQRRYEEISLFQKHETAAFINYSNLPYRIMESKELDILQFNGEEMTDDQFVNRILEWSESK